MTNTDPGPLTRRLHDAGLGSLAENDAAEPTALAFTPDEEVEAGVQRFKELWPDKWEAWLKWCREQDGETRVIPPEVTG